MPNLDVAIGSKNYQIGLRDDYFGTIFQTILQHRLDTRSDGCLADFRHAKTVFDEDIEAAFKLANHVIDKRAELIQDAIDRERQELLESAGL